MQLVTNSLCFLFCDVAFAFAFVCIMQVVVVSFFYSKNKNKNKNPLESFILSVFFFISHANRLIPFYVLNPASSVAILFYPMFSDYCFSLRCVFRLCIS